jgi:hypothetical protein
VKSPPFAATWSSSHSRFAMRAAKLTRGMRSYVQKYSPDQPRAPAGRSGGGQWTRGDGGGSGIHYAALDTGTKTDATEGLTPNPPTLRGLEESQVAQTPDWRCLPVDLVEEESPNGVGHAIQAHVGKSDAELADRLERESIHGLFADVIDGAEGSFDSVESANDLVNRTLRARSDLVDLVASGQREDAFVTFRFGSVTGYEIYRPDSDTRPYMRNTYAVGVFIWYDARAPRGFRVRTAYPLNVKPGED